jgi:NTE family protein
MSKNLGLVMTGGGARAAYQVGAVRGLYEILKKETKLFDVITGNSAGAINSSYLASYAKDWDMATTNLMDLWKKIKPQNIYDLRARTISELGFKIMGGAVFGGLSPRGSHVNHLLDTAPLRNLLKREVDFDDIQQNIKDKILRGVALSTTNYNSGSNVVFYQGNEDIKDWSRSDRFSIRENLNLDHIMASAAIPFFFPPIKVGESYYGDGCIRQTTPLSPAIHLGAEKIIAIGVRFPHHQRAMQEKALSPFKDPTIGQITGVMMNAVFLDSLESDVERMMKINSLIKEGHKDEFKAIPILMLRPSKDLGKMTERLNEEMPPMLRYLLKGIGVSDKEGLDLLSYLAFDKCYTVPLMELGLEDTLKRKSEIEDFIGA